MGNAINRYFGGGVSRDFFRTFCGKRIGKGIGRRVYAYRLNEAEFVVKLELGGQDFQNIMEWELWNAVAAHPETAKWLAPCFHISPAGSILVQRRTTPLRGPEELPKMIPGWMQDTKVSNWGLLDGRPVLHDYGFTRLLYAATRYNGKLRKMPEAHLAERKALDHVSPKRSSKKGNREAPEQSEGTVRGQEPGAVPVRPDAAGEVLQPARFADTDRPSLGVAAGDAMAAGLQDRRDDAGNGGAPD